MQSLSLTMKNNKNSNNNDSQLRWISIHTPYTFSESTACTRMIRDIWLVTMKMLDMDQADHCQGNYDLFPRKTGLVKNKLLLEFSNQNKIPPNHETKKERWEDVFQLPERNQWKDSFSVPEMKEKWAEKGLGCAAAWQCSTLAAHVFPRHRSSKTRANLRLMVWPPASEVHYMFLSATTQIYWSEALKMSHQKSRAVWVILVLHEFMLMLRDLSGQEELFEKSTGHSKFSLFTICTPEFLGFQVFASWLANTFGFPHELPLHKHSCMLIRFDFSAVYQIQPKLQLSFPKCPIKQLDDTSVNLITTPTCSCTALPKP